MNIAERSIPAMLDRSPRCWIDPRDVAEVIDRAETLERLIDHALPLLHRANVERLEHDVLAGRERLSECLVVDVDQREWHLWTAAPQLGGEVPADTARRAGDDRDLVVHARSPSWFRRA